MKLTFLGTAAAEGYPGIFCNCANCNEARALGGRNLRFRSVLLVNDNLLIDLGPDLLASAQRFNLNLSGITTTLITHAHPDHFAIFNIEMRANSFTGLQEIPTMHMFGPQDVTDLLTHKFKDLSLVRLKHSTVHAFDQWKVGDYAINAYRANHAIGHLEALFYSIDDGQHSFLYATDTGSFPDDTWKALEGRAFDTIIMEETLGHGKYDQHMSFETFFEHAKRMRAMGMLRPGGRLIAHHMSHTDNPVHDKILPIFNPHEVEVAYDGMQVNL